jgi:hypothetical protein
VLRTHKTHHFPHLIEMILKNDTLELTDAHQTI